MRLLVTTLAIGLLAFGCGPHQPPPSTEGEPCRSDAVCSTGLVCKAALCSKLRSAEGNVCVTDAGCVEGLRCTDGHCSSGRATAAECDQACGHVRLVIETEVRAQLRAAPEEEQRQMVDSMVQDIVPRCLARCRRSGTRESAACLSSVKRLGDLELCP